MKLTVYSLVLLEVSASVVRAQSLLNATASNPQLSNFAQLLRENPRAAAGLLMTGSQQQTILVPNNDAFNNYQQMTGSAVGGLSSSDLGNMINYHSLQGALSSSDLQTPSGLLSATALRNETYDNREPLSNGQKLPQVVYIGPANTSGSVKVKARQAGCLGSVDLVSGEGRQITLDLKTYNWTGGHFYIVDGFLTFPVNQTSTMMAQGLSSFVVGLNRTNVADRINSAPGLTCVCPNNEAFAAMGNLAFTSDNLADGPASLLATLTRHSLTGSYYTTNFTDGDLIYSRNGYPILVTRQNGSIFLNDAELVQTNYITNTGCVHGLDRIMGYLNATTNVTTPANASVYSNTSNIPSPTPSVISTRPVPPSSAANPTSTCNGFAGPFTNMTAGSPSGTSTGTTTTSVAIITGAAGVFEPQYMRSGFGVAFLGMWSWVLF